MKYSEGRIQGVKLVTFLQMVEQDKTTCTLTIRAGDKTGQLHFQEGVLVDAGIKCFIC